MKSPAKKRFMTTPEIVLYDQTGPAAGTRAATRSKITAMTSKRAATSFQIQPTFLTVFDPHFGHVASEFMGSIPPALCVRSIVPFLRNQGIGHASMRETKLAQADSILQGRGAWPRSHDLPRPAPFAARRRLRVGIGGR